MINTALLAEICKVAGAPGHEQRVREIVLREVKSLVDEIRIDNMGNVVAIKKGKESKNSENGKDGKDGINCKSSKNCKNCKNG